jgi:hypothetical protein
MSIVITLLPSDAAIAATVNTDDVKAVGEDKFSYSPLSCWSPPATSLALNLLKAQEAEYYPSGTLTIG